MTARLAKWMAQALAQGQARAQARCIKMEADMGRALLLSLLQHLLIHSADAVLSQSIITLSFWPLIHPLGGQ